MQSKGVIKLLAILLAIACIYQLSFSLKARSVEKKGGRVCRESFGVGFAPSGGGDLLPGLRAEQARL